MSKEDGWEILEIPCSALKVTVLREANSFSSVQHFYIIVYRSIYMYLYSSFCRAVIAFFECAAIFLWFRVRCSGHAALWKLSSQVVITSSMRTWTLSTSSHLVITIWHERTFINPLNPENIFCFLRQIYIQMICC